MADKSYLEQMALALGKEAVLQAFAQSAQDLREALAAMKQAIADGALADAQTHRHTMKGIALNMGLSETAGIMASDHIDDDLADTRFGQRAAALIEWEMAAVREKLEALEPR